MRRALSYCFRPCDRTIILRGHGGCDAPVIPWHPLRRTHSQFRGMPEQLRQVVERVDLVQFAGVDQAHEEIAHPRPVHRLIEERVLTVQDRFLQCPLDDIVIERRALLPQKQRQFRPVPQ